MRSLILPPSGPTIEAMIAELLADDPEMLSAGGIPLEPSFIASLAITDDDLETWERELNAALLAVRSAA